MAEDVTFYEYGKPVTDPKEIERRRKLFRIEQQAGHRSFSSISGNVLPKEFFDLLDDRGDNSFVKAIECNEKIDAFKPAKEEGQIRRLKPIRR